jgi:hypothetical protein
MNTTRPYKVKGISFTTPKGKALWCKNIEPDRKFNDKGDLTTSLVCDPNDEKVKEFIKLLEDLRDQAFNETKESLGEAKAKAVKVRPVFSEHTDRDGNSTGEILFKLKLKDVDEKKELGRQSAIATFDAKKGLIANPPAVGNDSVIRCAGFANPYYMASTKEVGVSLIWQKMQIIELQSLGGGDEFGEEEGFEAGSAASETQFEEAPF